MNFFRLQIEFDNGNIYEPVFNDDNVALAEFNTWFELDNVTRVKLYTCIFVCGSLTDKDCIKKSIKN